jgi:nitroreductase
MEFNFMHFWLLGLVQNRLFSTELTDWQKGVTGCRNGYPMSADFPYRTRRTIKPALMDSSREIAHELLIEILEDAHWAPTHGLNQPWRFHVFTSEARTRLAGALQTLYDQTTRVNELRAEKRAKLRENCLQAQAIIAIAAHSEHGGKISRLDELCATACAVQNLLLSAHQRGLGSFWATPPVACSPEFTTWLGLDSTHRSLGLVFLGYPKERPTPSIRVPLEERVTFHSA